MTSIIEKGLKNIGKGFSQITFFPDPNFDSAEVSFLQDLQGIADDLEIVFKVKSKALKSDHLSEGKINAERRTKR